jgi:hypothetical protein
MPDGFAEGVPSVPEVAKWCDCNDLRGFGEIQKPPLCPQFKTLSRPALGRLTKQPDNFALFGVPAKLRLLENRNAIAQHLEPSTTGRYQLDIRVRPGLPYLSRQTDGSWLIVSKRAVFNRDLHSISPRAQYV